MYFYIFRVSFFDTLELGKVLNFFKEFFLKSFFLTYILSFSDNLPVNIYYQIKCILFFF